MAFRGNGLRLQLFVISLLSLALTLLVFTSSFHDRRVIVHHERNLKGLSVLSNPVRARKKQSPLLNFLSEKFSDQRVKIGLVNIQKEHQQQQEKEEEWKSLGKTTLIEFERVPKEQKWEDYFPEWIDEEEKWKSPNCPRMPMPNYKDYDEFDVVVAKVPCGSRENGKGIRDVFRLQVNLVVANLVIHNGRKNGDHDDGDHHQPVYVVFVGSCGPMWEIFRCDDQLMHIRDVWVYQPDLRRLEQKVVMPVGTCKLAEPLKNRGKGKITNDFSKLGNPIQNPKEAYVTVLHSSEAYVCGAIALAQSIIQSNSTKDLILLADKSISKKNLQALTMAGWKIKHIERIRSPHAEKNAYNKWNYSKLRIWQLTEYDKVIFIDADLIVLKNMDKFFLYPQLSAVGNDMVLFNSGVMLIEPSDCVFEMLMKMRHTLMSYNGGDQGFLNEACTWWHRWPRQVNFLKNFIDVNGTQHRVQGEGVYAIHYLGLKPWMCYRDYDCNWDMVDHHIFASDSANVKWWQVYDTMPRRLQGFCRLTELMDARIRKWRRRAENASLYDGHWRIKVKDPRRPRCEPNCLQLY